MYTKILIMMDDVNYPGGAHSATFKIANFLVKTGKSVTIYTSAKSISRTVTEALDSKIKIVFSEKIDFSKYDCVVVPFENSMYRAQVAELKNIYKIQWVHIEYDVWSKGRDLNDKNEYKLYSAFDEIVFVAEHNRQSFLKHFPVLENKCRVVYNFLDAEGLAQKACEPFDYEIMQKKDPEEINVVLCGRLEVQKAYPRLIDAIKILNEDEKTAKINWFVLGQGYEYPMLMEKVQKHDIKNIHFLGHRSNPFPFVRQADLFAVLSEYEGLALVVSESLSVGTPVVSTRAGGVAEILNDNYGWIIDNSFFSIIDFFKNIVDKKSEIDEKRKNLSHYEYDNKSIEKSLTDLFGDSKKNKATQIVKKEKAANVKANKEIDISIIVPVYNMELYLEECLNSLVNQTKKEIEIIVVDDGSTDKSREIIDRFVYNYPEKVRAFTIPNGGLGEARNFGISKAKGRFLGFIDSDDAVKVEMFDWMYKEAIAKNADCVLCDYIATWESGKAEYVPSLPMQSYDRFDIIKYSAKYGVVNACTKLIAAELFDYIKFPKGFYEDLATIPIILSYAKNIAYLREGMYYYRQRSGSITSIKSNDKRLFDCYAAWDRILKYANPIYRNEIAFAVYWSVNFFCTNFLDEFTAYSTKYYLEHKNVFENNKYIETAIKNKEFLNFNEIPKIPKILHYCWFGKGPKSELINYCIKSWKKYAPDFEIVEWNEENCDLDENQYVREAYDRREYAFVSDYFRLKALLQMGGVYLDTDMELMKPIENFLYASAFFAFETPIFVHAGIIGTVPNNPIIKKIIDTYESEAFSSSGKGKAWPIPRRITEVLEKTTNLVKNGKSQTIDGFIKVYSANVMTMNFHDGNCVANHHYEGSWMSNEKGSTKNFGYDVMKHYFTWDLLTNNTPVNVPTAPIIQDNSQNSELMAQLQYYRSECERYENAGFWKITKPFRAILDFFKRIFKRK